MDNPSEILEFHLIIYYIISLDYLTNLLLREKGRLSPGEGRASSPLLATEVEKFLVDWAARLATWANIFSVGNLSKSRDSTA